MIKFKDITNEELKVIIHEEDFLIRAPLKYEQVSVEGMHGSDISISTFDNVEGSMTITLLDDNADIVSSWLCGVGEFEHNDRKTTMYFLDQVDYKRLVTTKTATLGYIRSPFWYPADDSYKPLEEGSLFSFGNTKAYPIIRLTKNNNPEVTIKINDIEFTYEFQTEDQVIIDCLKKQEFDEDGISRSRNLTIGYEYPFFVTGDNVIEVTGDATVEIKRKDCWL